MHRPGAVNWEVGTKRRLGLALAGLIASGLLSTIAFVTLQPANWESAALGVTYGLCSLLALTGYRRLPAGKLSWDGQQWHWFTPEAACVLAAVRCRIDWQQCMLLQADCVAGSTLWLWLESAHADAAWMAMRRAIVASAGSLSLAGPATDQDPV